MKIGFTGAHGTGKTTTAKQLADELGIPLITEVSRKVREQGFSILSKDGLPTLEAQMAIFGMQIFEEQKHPDFVSDRTLLDNMAYTSAFCLNDKNEELYEKMLDFSADWCYNAYDLIFYIPIQFELQGDGIRDTDIENQRLVDEEIKTIILQAGHGIYTINGDKEERLKKCLNLIKEKL